MSNTKQPAVKRAPSTRAAKAAAKKELDQGIAFTDTDGVRIEVRLGDVKGRHDAALVAATGMDFIGLMRELNRRQGGLDLLAAVVWFGRLVHGRENGEYIDILDDFSYSDLIEMDVGDLEEEKSPPA